MFAWADFFDLATLLSNQSEGTEASQRTAISRAYYAAFHVSRDFLIQRQRLSALARHRVHVTVWTTLSDSDSSIEQRIGQMGYRLMHIRHHADYDLIYPALDRDLRIVLRDVEWLIAEIAAISKRASTSP